MPVGKIIDRSLLAFLGVSALLLWARIAALQASPLNLHFDEAQYWTWSQHLAWGYFSKPPLVAWAIAGATALLNSNAEWVVRLAAPVAQSIAGLALYGVGRSLYGAWAGFWSGLGWLLLPAVSLSSGIISTDALLLCLWSLALFAFWRLVATRAWIWAIALGVFVGIGALAKYAMLYFVICAVLAALWSKPARAVMRGPRGAVAALIALAVLSPNLVWNVQNHFATIEHTAANARLTASFIHPGELLEFIASQILIIGPLLFFALVGFFWRAGTHASLLSDDDRGLLAFILPPLVLIMVEAFISRANGNWAATAYPAALVWVTGNLLNTKKNVRFLLAASALNLLLGIGVTAAAVEPGLADRVCIPFAKSPTCLSNAFKRARGWDIVAREVARRAMPQPGQPPFTAVLVDHRATYFELAYYWREARRRGDPLPPVRMWLLHADARNSAEQLDAMRAQEGARVLIVHANSNYLPLVAGDFTVFRTVDHFAVPLGPTTKPRRYEISVGEGFAPVPRNAAFEERLDDD